MLMKNSSDSQGLYNAVINYCSVFDNRYALLYMMSCRLRLKCDGTRAETRFRLSAKRTSPFKSAGFVGSVDYWQPRCAHQQ